MQHETQQGAVPEGSVQMLRMPDVSARTGLSASSIYRLIKDEDFPAPVRIAAKVSAWVEGEVDAWLRAKIAKRGPR